MSRDHHEANIDYKIRSNLEEIFRSDEALSTFRVANQLRCESGWADLGVFDNLEVVIVFSDKVTDSDTDNIEIHRRAREYAVELNSKFFVVSNIHHTYLYKFGSGPLINNKLKEWNNGADINLNSILSELINICLGRIPSDNFWFNFLEEYKITLEDLSRHLKNIVIDPPLNEHELIIFREEEKKIVQSFGMNYDTSTFAERERNYTILSRQATYILLNKIFCYQLIRSHLIRYPHLSINLPEIYMSSISRPVEIQIEEAFQKMIHRVDYAPIFKSDEYYNKIPFNTEMRQIIIQFIDSINHVDFSNLADDFVSDMYIHLIPISERKRLGQIYTPYQIAKTMAYLAIDSKDDIILDPACGSGTFLREVYQRLEFFKNNSGETTDLHRNILKQIWGIEINQFPAQLSMMNLALMKINMITEIVGIIVSDFFDITPIRQWSASSIDLRTGQMTSMPLPLNFHVIIGNPPYIRQENITNYETIKNNLPINADHRDFETTVRRGRKVTRKHKMELGKRCDIYAYFLWNATFFLKNHGRLCLIIPNKWLDVGYGIEIKQFIMDFFKILSILSFKANVFVDADVSTIILLLERESNSEARNNHIVRFLHIESKISNEDLKEYVRGNLTSPEIVSSIDDDIWDNLPQIKRTYVKQNRLNSTEKWSYRYLLQSQMLQKLRRSRSKIKLSEMIDLIEINGGLRTGAAEFFFLRQNQIDEYNIPTEFLLPGIGQGRNLPNDKILVNDIQDKFLKIPSDIDLRENLSIQRWIENGTEKRYHTRNYAWEPWWSVPLERIPMFDIVIKRHTDRELHSYYFSQENVVVSDGMQGIKIITSHEVERLKKFLLGVLNSNYFYWQAHVQGRWEAAGDLQILVNEFGNIEIPNYSRINSQKIDTIIEKFETFQRIFEDTNSEQNIIDDAKKELDLAVLDSMNLASEYDILIRELHFFEDLRIGRLDIEIMSV